MILDGDLLMPRLQRTLGKFKSNHANGDVEVQCMAYEDGPVYEDGHIDTRTLSLKTHRLKLEVVDVGTP